VGRYEGDTLVIDTIGENVGPLSMVDRYGTPFSPALHVIERYRLIDGTLARDLQQKHESVFRRRKIGPSCQCIRERRHRPRPGEAGIAG
jgi:hypothetical protein